MIQFRAFKPGDLKPCRKLIPNGAVEPAWDKTVLLDIDGKIRGWAAIREHIQVEPMGATDAFSATLLYSWIEGQLAGSEYQFFVLDSNEAFKRHVEKHFNVSAKYELRGTLYVCG
ncbi:MAG: hypothetical protein WB683_05120, partial [Candidatus Sulfotelmatobacter sp.]